MAINLVFHHKQTELYLSRARFKVAAAGRRGGKTYYAGGQIIDWTQKPMKGSDIYYVAPDKNQAVEIAWDLFIDMFGELVVKTNTNNAVIFVRGIIVDRHGHPRAGIVKVKFKGANDPDSLRGKGLRAVVLDEYADMKAEAWEVSLRPTLSDYSAPALFIGTPKGRNHFYRLFTAAQKDTTGTWYVSKFTTLDNPHIPREEIIQAEADMSPYAFAQEYLAEFDTGQSDVFKPEWIREVPDIPKHWRCVVAVDLAGYDAKELLSRAKTKNLDDCAIAVGFYHDDLAIVKEVINGRWTTQETARRIIQTCKENQCRILGIEKGIPLQALADTLAAEMRNQGWTVTFTELTHGNKEKTRRIVDTLQGHMYHGRLRFLQGSYISVVRDQFLQFPSPHAHDDAIDAISMLYQLFKLGTVPLDMSHYDQPHEALDAIAGY